MRKIIKPEWKIEKSECKKLLRINFLQTNYRTISTRRTENFLLFVFHAAIAIPT